MFVFYYSNRYQDDWHQSSLVPSSRDGCIPHHSDVVRLHKTIRMMPVPSALHWNPKMTTNVTVDNAGHLIVSISVVHQCQGTTVCHNVVNCFKAYTAQAASGTDISKQNVVLIIPSPNSLVLFIYLFIYIYLFIFIDIYLYLFIFIFIFICIY